MVFQLPMVCDSCAHRFDLNSCTAFPVIPLKPTDLHDEPLPGQDNDIVYLLDPDKAEQRDGFDRFRDQYLRLKAERSGS